MTKKQIEAIQQKISRSGELTAIEKRYVLGRVDAETVKHGKWLDDEYGYFSCPYCHFEWDDPEYFTSFCPECGAKLEGSAENG